MTMSYQMEEIMWKEPNENSRVGNTITEMKRSLEGSVVDLSLQKKESMSLSIDC